ncbi:MAG: peptidoglycan-binding protein [Acidimicrobiales bacterium]
MTIEKPTSGSSATAAGRNSRRWLEPLRWLAMAVLVAVVIAALLVFDVVGLLFETEEPEVAVPRERSEIGLSTLSTTVEADGALVFTDARSLSAAASGTLTAVATTGSEVTAGTVLFEIDGDPAVAFAGELPAWRAIKSGDVGPDVEQLEANLVALGYDPEAAMTVDETFTDYTATVVERWQTDVGLPVTGDVTLGSVVFVPSDGRVTSTAATIGQELLPSSNAVLTVSNVEREISFTVQPQNLDTIELGTEVDARLPDRSTVVAVVADLSSNGDGSWTATAQLADTGASLPDGESVPVTITWTHILAEQVKTVRANALSRLDDGSYVVEVVDPLAHAERTTFVAVETGAKSGSTIEIITDLEPGTVIIAP